MVGYEYKVIPAPAKGIKARGVKGPEARFAHAIEQKINDLAAEGWEYQRSDILPSEERQGLTSTQTVYRSVLVFRRAHPVDEERTDLPEQDTGASAEDDAATDEPAHEDESDTDTMPGAEDMSEPEDPKKDQT